MANAGGAQDLISWYTDIPIISRIYLTAAISTTTACFMDLVSPLTLYYNYDLVLNKGQYWRLLSSFLFFGSFSLDFLFHMYFVVRYCRLLEEGKFRGRTADFILMLIFGATMMLVFAVNFEIFSKIKFLGHPLAFMMVYVWARGAPYLPWVLFLFSLFLGNPIETDLLGILVGHIFYFLDEIYPSVAEIRGWRCKKILVAPYFLHFLCGTGPARLRVNANDPGIVPVHIHED